MFEKICFKYVINFALQWGEGEDKTAHFLVTLSILMCMANLIFTFRGVLINAKWEKWESHEQPTTLTSIFLNSSIWSLNDTNSVGQTNVLEQN